MKYLMNRMNNAHNIFQGKFKKVLCVCSAGLLRSPTIAYILSQEPYNYNTRAIGIVPEFALISLDNVLLHWADEIICVEQEHVLQIKDLLKENNLNKPLVYLNIPDIFSYREPKLIDIIKTQYDKILSTLNGKQ
jgi:predicted protein tyrosine phosphatase